MAKINLNAMIEPKAKDTKSDDICLRSKIDTGLRCNLDCSFCYTKKHIHDAPKSFIDICKTMDKVKAAGIKEAEFSGGESTVHPNWFDMLEYASNLFENVSLVINGVKLSNEEFLIQSKEKGLKEVLFSLHGWDNESHKEKTGRDVFDRIIEAIKLSKKHGLIVRINCVVDNQFMPSRYAALINSLKPKQVNFLPLNYWDDAKTLGEIDYTRVSEYLKQCIDLLKQRDEKLQINVRYIPFCFMEGYEQYCVGTYQHIFDKTDWNIMTFNGGLKQTESFLKKELVINKENMFKQAKINRFNTYIKPPSCTDCSYMYICDGIEKELSSQSTKLVPRFGKKVLDVNFLRNKNEKFEFTFDNKL